MSLGWVFSSWQRMGDPVQIFTRIVRFRREETGNVAVVFGLTLPVLALCFATAVDLSGIYGANRSLQQAADVAALAAGREYGRTQDADYLKSVSEAFFFHNAGEETRGTTQFSYDGVFREDGLTILKVTARRQLPTFFGDALMWVTGGTLDWRQFPLYATSEIVVQNRSIELALVLDNSGSMQDRPRSGGTKSKIDIIKDAAEDLAEQFLSADKGSTEEFPVQFAVVPFSSSVNVGPQYKNADWMDTQGRSPIHHENLDWGGWLSGATSGGWEWIRDRGWVYTSPSSGTPLARYNGSYWTRITTGEPLTRFYVYDNARYKSQFGTWRGCVEARPNGLAATDTEPVSSKPETLFVPTFAPDEYDDSAYGWNDYLDSGSGSPDSAKEAMAEQAKVAKYFDSGYSITTPSSNRSDWGPNSTCATTPITPLTKTLKTVTDAIDVMDAQGATNIPHGLAWGWRLLTARPPFTEGRSHDEPDNLKVLVLMTDGNNTYNLNSGGRPLEIRDYNRSTYGSYGYGAAYSHGSSTRKPGRIYDGTTGNAKDYSVDSYVAAMDQNVAKVCENVKADGRKPGGTDGILIFTIAFDLRDGEPVKKLMEDCASNGLIDASEKLYYDAQSQEELAAAFQSITEQISSLRIAR